MSKRYQLSHDGQSVTQADYNALALTAGTADDKVFAELFRLTPYDGSTVYRGVIPYGTSGIIVPNGASGKTKINPFRVVIGSRTAVGTDAALNWQDTRSAISIADAATTLHTLVTHAANASGDPRWDAIYATVDVADVSTPVTRKVKNPGTGVVTDESVSVYQHVTVAIESVAGSTGASPAFPAIPSDTGATYYVLLGYVRIPDGFGATSTVANKNINEVASVLHISPVTGVSVLRPANQQNVTGGTAISSAGTSAVNGVLKWTGTADTRPATYMPPSMVGSESIIFTIDALGASSANWSNQSGDIIDDSVDWRNRLFKWTACVGSASVGGGIMWASGGALGYHAANMPGMEYDGKSAYASGMGIVGTSGGNAAYVRSSNGGGAGNDFPDYDHGGNISNLILAANTEIIVGVDSSGRMIVTINGTPLASAIFWIEATAQYPNP